VQEVATVQTRHPTPQVLQVYVVAS